MHSRAIATALVVLSLSIAGCVGGVGTGGPEPTTTTIATTTATTPPPADDLITDDAEAKIRAAGSVTAVWSFENVATDGTVEAGSFTNHVDLVNERALFRMTGDSAAQGSVMEQFYADGKSYMRIGADGEEPFYMVSDAGFEEGNWLGVSHAYSAGDLEGLNFVGVETFDGDAVRHYRTTDPGFWWWGYSGSNGEDVTVTDFSYDVLVDSDGIVRSESWTVTAENDAGETESVSWEYTVTDIGSTAVEDPEWLQDAVENGQSYGN